MLSTRLKQEIERHAAEIGSHPLMQAARSGKVSPETVTRYLSGILELIRATPKHLELARSRARELGSGELERFFEQKLAEEQGHDRWAESDLCQITEQFKTAAAIKPSPAIRGLLDYLERVIESDPAAYVAYILLAEYGTVLMGPAWTLALKEMCNIPSSALSVIDRHAELDRHHVAEALSEVDFLLETQPDPTAPLRTLYTAIHHLQRFLNELSRTAPNLDDSQSTGNRAA